MRIEWKVKHGLTLKWDFKRPKVVFGSSFVEQTRFLREWEEKRGRKVRVCKKEWFWLGLLPISSS